MKATNNVLIEQQKSFKKGDLRTKQVIKLHSQAKPDTELPVGQ